jgi:nucleoside-diphosphate-sugar epimerase
MEQMEICMYAQKEIIIITGSSGFIGSSLARRLSSEYNIIGLDLGLPVIKIPNVDYRSLNIASADNVKNVLQQIRDDYGERIHSVVHLVAYYSFGGERSPKYEEITIKGTEFLLTSLNEFFQVEQFIFSSTMLVHAPTEPGKKITEESRLDPRWAYPESKVAAESTIASHRKNIPVVNLRIAGVYDDHCHSIPISQHIARIYECQFSSALFPGNSEHGQTFIHLEDLIDAFSLLIQNRSKLPATQTLLLAEEQVVSYKTLQETIGSLSNDIKWPVIRVPIFFAKSGAALLSKTPLIRDPFIKPWMIDFADDHYDVDISKIRSLLNWEPKRNLYQLLPGMVERLKANPEKWYQEQKIKKPPLKTIA